MTALIIVILIRLAAPMAVLRWPFWGMLIAIAADASDVMIFDLLGWGGLPDRHYHQFDKIFDIYYLSFAAYIASKWEDRRLKWTALALFWWRAAGVLLFELTDVRQVILFAPSIFENFYLIVAGLAQFFGIRTLKKRGYIIVLLAAALPKIVQEYIMHFLEFPTWNFIKTNIFRWR